MILIGIGEDTITVNVTITRDLLDSYNSVNPMDVASTFGEVFLDDVNRLLKENAGIV